MSKKVILNNMFGTEGKQYIYIPDESEDIIKAISSTYNLIYKYFSETLNVDELENSFDNLINEFGTFTESVSGKSLLDDFKVISNNYDLITSTIKNGDYNYSNTIGSIPFNITYYSIFKYSDNGSKVNYYLEEVDDNIYEIAYDEEVGKNVWRFKPDNNFFNLMDAFIGESWRDSGATLDPPAWFSGKQKDIDIVSLLTKGYYKFKNNYYYVFKDETEIKYYIYSCVSSSTKYVKVGDGFTINFPIPMHYGLQEKMEEAIKEKITKQTTESLNLHDFSYQFGTTDVKVRSVSDDVNKYKNIFEYATGLAKSYIEELRKSDAKVTTNSLYKDPYIYKLFNKIVGITNDSSGFKFNKNTKTKIFDSENYGAGIIAFLSSKIRKYSNDYLAVAKDDKMNSASEINLKKSSQKEDANINSYIIGSFIKPEDRARVRKSEDINIINKDSDCTEYFNSLSSLLNDNDDLNKSFYFYETAIYGDGKDGLDNRANDIPRNAQIEFGEQTNELEYCKQKIDEFCKISGTVISKFVFVSLFDIKKIDSSDYKLNNKYILQCSNFKYSMKYSTTNQIMLIDGEYFYEYDKAYESLGKKVLSYLNEIIKISGNLGEDEDRNDKTDKIAENFNSYIKSRISDNYFTEKDYFYINDNGIKRVPSNSFVDIEFRVPDYSEDDTKINVVWIPVTSVRTHLNTENDADIVFNKDKGYREIHAGTYFDSLELTDNGGIKEISLNLKSVNDMNLEKIIFNSLSLDNKLKAKAASSDNIASYLDKMLKDTDSNFRVRFGYRDVATNDPSNNETTITDSNNSDKGFLNRTRTYTKTVNGKDTTYVKPVMVYPWTYFKITGLDSRIKDGDDTYSIKGISSGSYILDNMSLCGISTNFSRESSDEDFRGTPKNVVGKLAKWITLASTDNSKNKDRDITTARICFLGDEQGTIITDFNNLDDKFESDYRYVLKGESFLSGGNIETIEDKFFNASTNQVLNAKNFNITNDVKMPSVKEIMDSLMKWLPDRVYYIAKVENRIAALYIPYDTIYKMGDFFGNNPYKTEKMSYQVIEADAHIYKDGEDKGDSSEDGYFHKVYFIRMYFEGPGLSASKDGTIPNEYLRIYNYRSLQEQVIENVEISSTNDSEFGNTVSSVMLLGSGTPVVFTYDKESGVTSNELTSVSNGDTISRNDVIGGKDEGMYSSWFTSKSKAEINPKLVYNNSQYILSDVKGYENFDAISSMYEIEASRFFTDQQNKQYEGEITILGDPFYYFDSEVQAGKYEIYLQMNRVKNMKTYEIEESKYSGVYFIKGIRHNIDSTGKYLTTLSVVKRIFGNDDGSSSK